MEAYRYFLPKEKYEKNKQSTNTIEYYMMDYLASLERSKKCYSKSIQILN